MIKKTTNAPSKTLGVRMYSSNTGCCPTGLTQCEYSAGPDSDLIANLRAITVTLEDGTDAVWTLAAADYASVTALKAFIKTKASLIGYYFSEEDGIEVDSPSVTIDDTANTIAIISELVFKSYTDAGSNVTTFTAKCTRTANCPFEVIYEGGTNPVFTVAGIDYTATGVFPYTGNAVDDAVTATALGTAIALALLAVLNIDYFSVSVAVDTAAAGADPDNPGAYVITINGPYGAVIVFDGNTAASSASCTQDWIV